MFVTAICNIATAGAVRIQRDILWCIYFLHSNSVYYGLRLSWMIPVQFAIDFAVKFVGTVIFLQQTHWKG